MRGSITVLPDNMQGYSSGYYNLLTVFDFVFSSLVVCPCVVTYWRGAWGLMDIYTQDFSPLTSGLISSGIGLLGHAFFTIFQQCFEDNFHPDKHRLLYYVTSRLYTVFFAFTCVNGWRGPFGLLDIRFGDAFSLMSTTMIGIVALVFMKALRNVVAPPLIIVNDHFMGYFKVMTMFRTRVSKIFFTDKIRFPK